MKYILFNFMYLFVLIVIFVLWLYKLFSIKRELVLEINIWSGELIGSEIIGEIGEGVYFEI